MGTLALGYFNRVCSRATVSGGSWLAALPSSNVRTPERAAVARSSTDATTDTKLLIDLGAAYTLRIVAFDAHNLSDDGQWRVKLGTTSGASDVYSGSLVDWLQATGVESTITEHGASKGTDLPALLVLPADYSARYLTIEIEDTTNAAGYVEIGYVFAGPALVPSINPEYGAWADSRVDLSTKSRARNGAVWTDAARRHRATQLSLGSLTQAEADVLDEIQRVQGIVGSIVFVADIDDLAKSQRYGGIGTLRELSALENPYYARRGLAVAWEQD